MLATYGRVVEVRALADGVTHAGYFDGFKALVFVSLHPVPSENL